MKRLLHSVLYKKGSILDDVSNRARCKESTRCTSRALEFLLSYGNTHDSLTCHTTTGKIVAMPLLSGTTDIGNSNNASTSTEANLRVLYMLDRFGVSDKFYQ